MTRKELIALCLTFPDAIEDYPFGGFAEDPDSWTAMRHTGSRKAFAFLYERDGLVANLKCEPLKADFLRQLYSFVTPAYHMNKTHWNSVKIADCPTDILLDMLEDSYQLTKK